MTTHMTVNAASQRAPSDTRLERFKKGARIRAQTESRAGGWDSRSPSLLVAKFAIEEQGGWIVGLGEQEGSETRKELRGKNGREGEEAIEAMR
jgi:hypothetical protein